jgi:hypothetical protein
LRLARGCLDQEGLLGRVEDDVIGFGCLDEAGRDGGDTGGQERSLRELHLDGSRRICILGGFNQTCNSRQVDKDGDGDVVVVE